MPDKILDQMKGLPAEYPQELLPAIRQKFMESGRTIVVLDDDPTGTQTSYDVTVLTDWKVALLTEELKKKPSILFILTNSRSLHEAAAIQLAFEIGHNLKEAVRKSGQEIIALSRSDSTLRGHFPAEVDALAEALDMEDAVTILVPAFIEGGRYTLQDVHYIKEGEELVPVADTPFARDAVFGYSHSNLRDWVEEKSKGKIKAGEVISFSLEDIRLGGPERVYEKLSKCAPGEVCIVNACSLRDLEVFVMGVLLADRLKQKFIFRTSATVVTIMAGLAPGKKFESTKLQASANGSLVIVGSYVPKTTSQLEYLLAQRSHESIEINVTAILQSQAKEQYADMIIKQTDGLIAAGQDVVIYTSRKLETGKDAEHNLRINSMVSSFLVNILQGLTVRPAFIVAKGGITSSDLASKGLMAEKALILGQILAGVPVWQMSKESKFPDIIYVVFPGNVGDHTALADVCKKLKESMH
ncbi:MAG: four-carbon acid sugar kinase family protein [Cyclobacteriaceae bacterium]